MQLERAFQMEPLVPAQAVPSAMLPQPTPQRRAHCSLACLGTALGTPTRVLVFFCAVMTLTWFDLGAFSSNGVSESEPEGKPGMVMDLGLSTFEDGVLGAMCVWPRGFYLVIY
jgi:hypothetical protein